ncbi:MAG: nicotinate (nicotinamide) nucleotide adenylyltransferase [Ignavibacteriales bacterium]|nr:nicotinate (nicotinamide) nucleotide adenylyltransferase [Ignavibacteriales bacterium]
MKNKILLFGGTFDPVHIGHLITARFVFENRKADSIIFMPNYQSPLKTDFMPTPTFHRLNMLQLALLGLEGFIVSDFEINRKQISYTYQTIEELSSPENILEIIIGYDNLLVFEKWMKPDLIVEKVKLLVLKRNTHTSDDRNRFFKDAVFLDTPRIDISSTEIRNRVKSGRSIDFMVPEKVKEYILENNLYK